MQQVYKLMATVTQATDGAATMDIRADGTIVGIFMELIALDADALADGASLEISFQATNAFAVNDTTGSIGGLQIQQSFLTSGGGPVSARQYIPMDVPVNSGERIFMHIDEAGAPSAINARCWFYIEEKAGASRARVARR